jgi:aminopeptidase N
VRILPPRTALAICLLTLTIFSRVSEAKDPAFHLLSHNLTVTLEPATHRLRVMDRVALRAIGDQTRLHLMLNEHLVVASVSGNGQELSVYSRKRSAKASGPSQASPGSHEAVAREIVIELNRSAKSGEDIVLDFEYAGELNDPPREPRHLRFVTPSETSGHIGPEGVYIGPETAWYPDQPMSLASYHVTVATPATWETVGQGKLVGRQVTTTGTITTWDTGGPAEGLTLTAGRYIITTRNCDGIETGTYLYPEEQFLADTYLDSACDYLRAYIGLLGPYPLPRFSVVENFFAGGLGLPSYTLLGAGTIRRRYVQPYALGHEIVHSWIGNHVYNDSGGNWVEGLTTYLANYYWYELQGDEEEARLQRRLMLFTYAVYVPPERDYPIAQFRQKVDQRDGAVGYSKSAMVFHMLRREIGDAAFFGTLKRLVAEWGGRRAGWRDLERLFSKTAARDLRPFFTHWIEQSGALSLPASADPDFNLFRRIPRTDLPPMLNLFVTDPRRLIILPAGDMNAVDPYRGIAERVSRQEQVQILSAIDAEAGTLDSASILILGGPAAGGAIEWARKALPGGVSLDSGAFRVGGKEYRDPGNALLLSIRNPDDPAHVVSIFYGLTPDAAQAVAPWLFFYGWDTYVVFDKGKVVHRGDEGPKKS